MDAARDFVAGEALAVMGEGADSALIADNNSDITSPSRLAASGVWSISCRYNHVAWR